MASKTMRETMLAVPNLYQWFKSAVGGLDRYITEFVKPRMGERILDIGCGTGDMLEWLGDVDYVGFDISNAYIEHAIAKHGGRGRFFQAAVGRDVPIEHERFDLVLANGVLHHLNDEESLALFELARDAMVGSGRLVTLDGCFVPGQSRLARVMLKWDRGEYIRSEQRYLDLARSVFPTVTSTILHDLTRLPYTHIVMQCACGRHLETPTGEAVADPVASHET